jgi:glycosyltransferase involved in cell wall biosynthesis
MIAVLPMGLVRQSKAPPKHITVCICTFRRPELLRRLLVVLEGQRSDGQFKYSVVVADNDAGESSRSVVAEFDRKSGLDISYRSEPRQNIALARNKALEGAKGDYIAFIDDDEFPAADWLLTMLTVCENFRAAGVLGPVRPHFEQPPPRWIIDGRFCERPEHPTGRVMHWEESRTGNLLFRRDILDREPMAFRPEFGTGGEDKDFFMRMSQRGLVFRWCNEGLTYESVPPSRWKRSYMLKRALLRGKNILKHPGGRGRLLAKSFVAVPVHAAALPFTLLAGQHVFMKTCIKLCDHLGRILAWLGYDAVRDRQM